MKLKHFLLTALILFTGVGGVYATKLYVGFTTESTHTDLQTALMAADANDDTVCVATGLYLAGDSEFLVPEGVTLIGGYNKGSIAAPRHYPGEFIPFDSSVVNLNQFTILDGNSYQRSRHTEKHRVIRVENRGVVDGCLIRNGHIRNGNGGGVLLDGGKLYNSIVRGNVAMSKPDTTIESLGGGVFIQNGGELINCLVAYNMANDGYGVAAGTGGGKMINNTITANTYAPVFAKIPGGKFQMYKGTSDITYHPASMEKLAAQITLNDFYISRTLTTEGQYAVFCAAMDVVKSSTTGQLNVTTLGLLKDPIAGDGTTVTGRYNFNGLGNLQDIFQVNTVEAEPGLNYSGGVWYPHLDTASVEYPMGYVSWYGSLAYSVWLGGGLPTEAQWEFAARRNPVGENPIVNENLYSGAYGPSFAESDGKTNDNDTAAWRILDSIAWMAASVSIDTTAGPHFGKLGAPWTDRAHEVARKRPNAMGIYDMTGLMFEWQADTWNSLIGNAIYSDGTTDPIRTNASTSRARRSGSAWGYKFRGEFKLNYRGSLVATNVQSIMSFRPVAAF